MIIHDNSDGNNFFTGACYFGRALEDYGTIYSKHSYFPYEFSDQEVADRNASITEAWQCPNRRERQSDKVKASRAAGDTKHSDPAYQERMSAIMSKVYECPLRRARAADIQRKAWTPERKAAASIERKAFWAARRQQVQ